MRHRTAGTNGFTAIELVLVLGVTALMGAVAVSAFRTYTARQQIAASVVLAGPTQDQVARAFRRNGVPPADAAEAGLSPDLSIGDYVASVRVVDGRVELKFGAPATPALVDRVLSLTPFETADRRIVWVCGEELPGVGLKPLGFAGGSATAPAVTTVEERYLPAACR